MNTSVFWCTGLSGSGKSTLANGVINKLAKYGKTSLIIDGDEVRERYPAKLGYGRIDVERNNLNVAKYCFDGIGHYDCIIVPIISPIDEIRKKIRMLFPDFYLIYVYSDIQTLRRRDTKGLYEKADSGELKDLIGYSVSNPYDTPDDYDLIINTSNDSDKTQSINLFLDFILDSTA